MAKEYFPSKGGAPWGNRNARKHGFYSKKLTRKQQHALEAASDVHGLDQEIALLRIKIQSIVETDPDNHELLIKAMSSLTRMVKAKTMMRDDHEGLHTGLLNVFNDIAAPMGYWPAMTESGEPTLVKIVKVPGDPAMPAKGETNREKPSEKD